MRALRSSPLFLCWTTLLLGACTSVSSAAETSSTSAEETGADESTGAESGTTAGGYCVESCEQASDCINVPSNMTPICDNQICYGEFTCFEHYACQPGWSCVDLSSEHAGELPFQLTTCRQQCADVSECGVGDDPLHQSENFRCEDSLCKPIGCASDEACNASMTTAEGFAWECVGDADRRSCRVPCTADADCQGFSDSPVELCHLDLGYCWGWECQSDTQCGGFVETCTAP